MNIKLHRPLCVFDLETTGIKIDKDRIVEICIVKIYPNGDKETKTWRVNPQIPIPIEASLVHGIYDEDVAESATLAQIAPKIMEMIKDTDLGGFNAIRFDIPLLAEELLRAGYDFDRDKHQFIDAQVIYHKKEKRDLSAAYQFYCDKTLENAHSAEADTMATFEILDAQVGKYDDIGCTVEELAALNHYRKSVDLAGFILYDAQDNEVFGFGKYKDKKVKEVFAKDLGYFSWIQNADFPLYTKKVLTKIQLSTKF